MPRTTRACWLAAGGQGAALRRRRHDARDAPHRAGGLRTWRATTAGGRLLSTSGDLPSPPLQGVLSTLEVVPERMASRLWPEMLATDLAGEQGGRQAG